MLPSAEPRFRRPSLSRPSRSEQAGFVQQVAELFAGLDQPFGQVRVEEVQREHQGHHLVIGEPERLASAGDVEPDAATGAAASAQWQSGGAQPFEVAFDGAFRDTKPFGQRVHRQWLATLLQQDVQNLLLTGELPGQRAGIDGSCRLWLAATRCSAHPSSLSRGWSGRKGYVYGAVRSGWSRTRHRGSSSWVRGPMANA